MFKNSFLMKPILPGTENGLKKKTQERKNKMDTKVLSQIAASRIQEYNQKSFIMIKLSFIPGVVWHM